MVSKSENSGSWPHHKNKNTGKMVPCASNPCKLHSGKGTDLMIPAGVNANDVNNELENIQDYIYNNYYDNNSMDEKQIKNVFKRIKMELVSDYNSHMNFNATRINTILLI